MPVITLSMMARRGRSVYPQLRSTAVKIRGVEPTGPCHIPSQAANELGFKEAYDNRGGVLAEVVFGWDHLHR